MKRWQIIVDIKGSVTPSEYLKSDTADHLIQDVKAKVMSSTTQLMWKTYEIDSREESEALKLLLEHDTFDSDTDTVRSVTNITEAHSERKAAELQAQIDAADLSDMQKLGFEK